MTPRARFPAAVAVVAIVAATCAAWAVDTRATVTLDGSTISTDVRVLGGRAYVPLSDVAKVLNTTVVRRGGTYALVGAGAARPVGGTAGKPAGNAYSGGWRFRVSAAERATQYSCRYGLERDPLKPTERGDILVILRCQLSNATGATQDVSFDAGSAGNTALTDDQAHGYVPLAYDLRNSSYGTSRILPGGAQDFVLVFSVPEGARLGNLIYTVSSSDSDKTTNFRVSLPRAALPLSRR